MTTVSSSNKYIFDPESPVEMTRLIEQDRAMTKAMGGPLAGIDPSSLHNVLDIACGPGSWVLDVAFDHPTIEVAGIDISETMVAYANARARTQRLPNASFGIMDITQPLDFADASFDMVNARLLFAVLSRHSWPTFIAECTRILRPGGILRLTEPVDIGETNSVAHGKINGLLIEAMHHCGYGFSTHGRTLGVTYMLPHLLRNAGYQDIQYRSYVIDYSAGTENWINFYHITELVFEGTRPILINMGLPEDEVNQLIQQMLIDMQQDDFAALGHSASFWGKKSGMSIPTDGRNEQND